MTLPNHVVEEDRRLDGTATSAQEQLARLRWHWTLDESNPDRVSFREYGAAVGLSDWAIRVVAHGFAAWNGASDIARTLTECIELAKLGSENRAAAEAVAVATGRSPANVAANHRDKIRETVHAARDAAERRGTRIEDEIPRVAHAQQAQRESAARQRAERQAAHSLRYVEVEGHLAAAKDRLTKAIAAAAAVDFDDEEVTLIADMVRQINRVLQMLDARFVGDSGVDWDAEAHRLLGEGTR